jgi:enamine deaminase RidA (YjgF/YER057c/UK114 family)
MHLFSNKFIPFLLGLSNQSSEKMASTDIERFEVAARYSEAVVFNGATVYLAGQVPENTGGMNATAQTKDVLSLIDQRLKSAGSDKSRILTATIYLTNMERDYSEMNEVWDAWIPSGTAPARTTVGVSALARPEWCLEITVTAARN